MFNQGETMKKIISILIGLLILFQCGSGLAAPKAKPDNYIPQYKKRYERYAKKHPKMSEKNAIMRVNLRLDYANYKGIIVSDNPSDVTVLVTKHFALPRSYKPKNLVRVDRKYAASGVTLRKDCYDSFLAMAKAMKKEGLTLYAKSGYRVNRKRGGANSQWYAWPGHSEHQTGLAFDLIKKGVSYPTLGQYRYQNTKEFKWLCKNAHKFGFINSFPKDKTSITGFAFEPWHWRYVGIRIATDMKKKGVKTYHEYWAKYLIQRTAPTKIKLNQKSAAMAKGKTLALKVKEWAPKDAIPLDITWSSSNPKIAKVSSKGVVQALKKGKVTITATTWNVKSAICTIKVN